MIRVLVVKQLRSLKTRCRESGQAMVEFVILLIAIMILCMGMLYVSRTLQADWWAQHDARFVAWEETWAPNWAGRNGKTLIANHAHFKRPRVVQAMSEAYISSKSGGMRELLDGATGVRGTPVPTPTAPPTPTPTPTPICVKVGCDSKGNNCSWDCWTPAAALDDDTRFAKAESLEDSLLYGKSEPWLRQAHDFLSGVSVANALSDRMADWSGKDIQGKEEIVDLGGREQLVGPVVDLLREGEFGKVVCSEYKHLLTANDLNEIMPHIYEPDCAERQNDQFGRYLVEQVDLHDLFRGYENLLDEGYQPNDALQEVVGSEAAHQYYRYFDTQVNAASAGAVGEITSHRVQVALRYPGAVQTMVTNMRYMGSSIALTVMGTQLARINTLSASSRSNAAHLQMESAINRFLHANADDVGIPFLPISVSGFWLPLNRIPIPPFYGIMAAGIFDGLMKNVLSRDDSLQDSLIDNGIIDAQATYQTSGGESAPIRRRWNKRHDLVAKYTLLTEPWHITRRTSATGGFRSKGSQTDGMSSNTEEGVMRRRVVGLWFFPSDPVALLDPIKYAIPGSIGAVVDQIRSVRHLIVLAKRMVTDDNPLRKIFDAVMSLPVISTLRIRLPQWPAVRPDAYPGSNEMSGDRLTISGSRRFSDYVGEQ